MVIYRSVGQARLLVSEAEEQFSGTNTYKKVQLPEKKQTKLVEKSNSMFEELKKKKVITEREKKHFKFNFKKATNVGNLYLPPKIHKRLSNVSELWYPHRKTLRSSFAATNERRKVEHKR